MRSDRHRPSPVRGAATNPAERRASAVRRLAALPWAQALWSALLVLHVWPLAKVGSGILAGEGGWGALAALLGTQALFALKLANVRWLRMPSRRGAVVAFVLATCLAHPVESLDTLGHGVADTAAVATLVAAPAAARRRPRRWLSRLLEGAARTVENWRRVAAHGLSRRAYLAPVPVLLDARPPGRAPPRSVSR